MTNDAAGAEDRLAAIRRTAQQVANTGDATARATGGVAPKRSEPGLVAVVTNIALGSMVLLLCTGIHLFFYSQPLLGRAGESQLAGGTSGLAGLSELSRQLHTLSAWLFVVAVVVRLLFATRGKKRTAMLASLATGGLLVAAIATGSRASWSAITLRSETADYPSGILGLYDTDVLEILRGDTAVSATELVAWFGVHLVFAGSAAVAAGALLGADATQ